MADIIKVTFLDGTEYCYKSPVNTVLAVLRKIGEEKFPSISLMRGKNRIVSQSYSPEIKKYPLAELNEVKICLKSCAYL